jgi:multiple sugar transport system permease protein
MLVVIVKSNDEFSSLPYWGFPRLQNIPRNLAHNAGLAWKKTQIGVYFINSMLYAVVAGVGSALLASLAGYALTQLKIKAPQAWFIGIFIGNVFPFQMFLIPLYLVLNYIKLYDTRIGLSIAYIGICVPFALFVYRNYAYTLPGEIFDAAKVDGASKWGSYLRIFLPMSKPAFVVIFCFQFIWTWNDLIFGLVLSERFRPVMTSLSKLQGQRGGVPPPILITGAIIASIPTVIILLTLQKYFVRGFTLTMEK